jgi:hypothetical protein
LGLRAPRGELFVHEQWFPQTAMDAPLNADARVADKWKDLFVATFDLSLYGLASTCFEGDVDAVPKARRGGSRDHRPDGKQLVPALLVTPEGFPLTCEVFPGNRLDRTPRRSAGAGGVPGLLPVGLLEEKIRTQRAEPDAVADPGPIESDGAGGSVV